MFQSRTLYSAPVRRRPQSLLLHSSLRLSDAQDGEDYFHRCGPTSLICFTICTHKSGTLGDTTNGLLLGRLHSNSTPFFLLAPSPLDTSPLLSIYLSPSSVEIKDISLTDYIQIRHAVYLPHTAGRYAKKQFKKAQMPIVERLVDR